MFDYFLYSIFVDMSIMEYRSSTIAMAATLIVMDPHLTKESLEIKLKTAWVNQLFDHVSDSSFLAHYYRRDRNTTGHIISCCNY